MAWAWSFLAFAFPILVIVALGFLWPKRERSWGWALFGHALFFFVAVGLGFFWANVEGFGFAVGDPPYGTGEATFDFAGIWLKAALYVIVALYVARALLWLIATSARSLKG
jgi:hypothetical protein